MAADDGGSQSNLVGMGHPERVETAAVTANFLAVLGVQPILGGSFLPDEDRPDGPLVILLTDSFWRRKFNADPWIVGRLVNLDGQVYTVVGVLPASFRFPDKAETPQCLRPFQLPLQVDWDARDLRLTHVIGRLAPGFHLPKRGRTSSPSLRNPILQWVVLPDRRTA